MCCVKFLSPKNQNNDKPITFIRDQISLRSAKFCFCARNFNAITVVAWVVNFRIINIVVKCFKELIICTQQKPFKDFYIIINLFKAPVVS